MAHIGSEHHGTSRSQWPNLSGRAKDIGSAAAKDIGSAAVFVSLTLVVVIWIFVSLTLVVVIWTMLLNAPVLLGGASVLLGGASEKGSNRKKGSNRTVGSRWGQFGYRLDIENYCKNYCTVEIHGRDSDMA
ncbi:hypothetical protein AB6D20_027460 (plasmid) [Vibrio splendidus]